jgi:transposase/macrodomain Ter protein organizer (MatP/YcbG family)
MNYITGEDRQQSTLFPAVLDEYIRDDNPVRFIEAFVGHLDLKKLGFHHTELPATGRPPYQPSDLLKLYIYGYLNKTRSSRQLEKATHRNVEVMWLVRKLTPDFKTIADFRKENLAALKQVCREFTVVCKKLELFSCELEAIDGSKFAAVNHSGRTFTKKRLKEKLEEIDKKVTEYFTQLDCADTTEAQTVRLSAAELNERIAKLQERKILYEQLQEELTKSGEKQISLTDPDSRLMMSRQGGADVGYNVQVVVDEKHKLIVDYEVTNEGNDQNQLSAMAHKAKETLGVEHLSVVTDMGYYKETEIQQCHENHITCYLSEPNKSTNTRLGLFTNKDFRYEKEQDCYICPAQQQLPYRTQCMKSGKQMKFYEGTTCKTCALRSRCTRSKSNNRRIERWIHEHLIDELRERMHKHPEMVKKRREIVEHPFGTIKRWMGCTYFLMKGKAKVAAEMGLTFLAYNMMRVMNILGVPGAIEKLKGV